MGFEKLKTPELASAQPLSADIAVSLGRSQFIDMLTCMSVSVGNTGLEMDAVYGDVIYFPNKPQYMWWEFHYTPEDARDKVTGIASEYYAQKYRLIFAYAWHHLLEWLDTQWETALKDPKLASPDALRDAHTAQLDVIPTILQGRTSYVMMRFMQNFFGSDVLKVGESREKMEKKDLHAVYFCELHLDVLRKDRQLRQKITEQSTQCEEHAYTMISNLHSRLVVLAHEDEMRRQNAKESSRRT